jgi:16S rRNA (adenine1518-N6/adenine1519-N6)-dimethyltransferase
VTHKTPLERVREALDPLGRSPLRSLSQNFLIDPNLLRAIVEAGGVTAGARVLEVGPGPGTLTAELLAAGAHVLAVELDRDLCAYLRKTFADDPFELLEGDAVRTPPELPPPGGWRVVANLPYAITSPFLARLVDWHPMVDRAVLMVQREVAERVCAGPGGRDRSSLGVFLQRYYECHVERIVPPTVFLPPPKVHSAVLGLVRREPGRAPRQAFERLLRAAFGQRRKMLRRSLVSGPTGVLREWLPELLGAGGLTGEERAEDVAGCAFEAMAYTLSALEGENPCEC